MRHHYRVTVTDDVDADLLIDFRGVMLRRGGRLLVGPVDWQVELDERWVVIGPTTRPVSRPSTISSSLAATKSSISSWANGSITCRKPPDTTPQ